MTDEKDSTRAADGVPVGGKSTKEEVALELMRFIATTTGVGKPGGGAGFAGKAFKSSDEQVDALIALYERCKTVVGS